MCSLFFILSEFFYGDHIFVLFYMVFRVYNVHFSMLNISVIVIEWFHDILLYGSSLRFSVF